MISRAANRAALAAVPVHEYRIRKNDTTDRGHGAHQHLAMLTSHRRYQLRQAGCISPLGYGTMDQALDALGSH